LAMSLRAVGVGVPRKILNPKGRDFAKSKIGPAKQRFPSLRGNSRERSCPAELGR
jgi:hypothetical protein